MAERAAARQIVTNGGEAQAIRRRLIAGEPFENARQAVDRRSDAKPGRSLGWVQREVPVRGLGQNPAFIESVLAVPQGGVSRPLRTNLGYHVVKVETHEDAARSGPGIRPQALPRAQDLFPEVRNRVPPHDRLPRDEVHGARGREGAPWRGGLRRAGGPPALRAGAGTDAVARIKLYEQIVEKHGESKFAAQAQFMIGFVYAEELKDESKARAALEQVIARYPQSELVDSARWMLENMAWSPGARQRRSAQVVIGHGPRGKSRGRRRERR